MTVENELNWVLSDKDRKYNQTIIKRATSKYGTYSTVTTLTDIRTTKYIDIAGQTTSWYKIQFYDSTNAVYSPESLPMQAVSTVSDTNYTTPKKVAQRLNNYRTIIAEAVGTGDATTTVFGPVADPKIIADTEVVYVAGVVKIRNVEYTFDYETGKITFTSAPANLAAITADYWASTHCLNSVYVQSIKEAEDEINRVIGRSFYQPQQVTEYVDSFDPLDSQPYSFEARGFSSSMADMRSQTSEALYSRMIKLDKFPVISILQIITNAQPTTVTSEAVGTGTGSEDDFALDNTSVVYGSEIIYINGAQTTAYTIDYEAGTITFTSAPSLGQAITADYTHCNGGNVLSSSDYIIREDPGILLLKSTAAQIRKNVSICAVTYNYGYYDIPGTVSKLATLIAGVYLLESTLLGTQAPQDVQRSNIGTLLGQIRNLYDTMGRKLEVTRI